MSNYIEEFMNSDDSDIPLNILEEAQCYAAQTLPEKSREKYERCYESFMDWRKTQQINSFEEPVFMAYFGAMSKIKCPTTLWSAHSMLKKMLALKQNINLDKFVQVTAFLKRQEVGYKPKKAKILLPNQVKQFLKEAPDFEYLLTKVILIVGVLGTCRKIELHNLLREHVEDDPLQGELKFSVYQTKNYVDRFFIIDGEFYPLVKKYMDLRPKHTTTNHFFLKYHNGRCSNQNVGEHTFGKMPQRIAHFLELESPADYTGHTFRHTSASILADSGASMSLIQRAGGWKSQTVAQGYISKSNHTSRLISRQMRQSINFQNASKVQPLHTSTSTTNENQLNNNCTFATPNSRIEPITRKTDDHSTTNKENEDMNNNNSCVETVHQKTSDVEKNQTRMMKNLPLGMTINNYGTINFYLTEK